MLLVIIAIDTELWIARNVEEDVFDEQMAVMMAIVVVVVVVDMREAEGADTRQQHHLQALHPSYQIVNVVELETC